MFTPPLKIIFSILDTMINGLKYLNLSYIPIMDNYPQFENITKVILKGELGRRAALTMEKGIGYWILTQYLVLKVTYSLSAFVTCQRPCEEVNYRISKDTYYDESEMESNMTWSSIIMSFERNWSYEKVSIAQNV